MKGAIGNAFILNIVITFVTIFLLLVVGSMAYTKAIKVRNYLLVEVEKYHEAKGNLPKSTFSSSIGEWDGRVNSYLSSAGYPLATKRNSCPNKAGYAKHIDTRVGQYEYCIYKKSVPSTSGTVEEYVTYMVLVYMKFDLPIVGNYIKIPITGETKSYWVLK